jgi:hypothetical protein
VCAVLDNAEIIVVLEENSLDESVEMLESLPLGFINIDSDNT